MFTIFNHEKKVPKVLENLSDVKASINLSDTEILMKIEMIRLSLEDLKVIRLIQPLIEENIEVLVNDFYNTILKVEVLKKIIEENSSVERLRNTLRIHLIELFNGYIDEDFMKKRLKVAKIHFHIGLQPAWYMGAFQNLQNTLLNIIYSKIQNRQEAERISLAVTKVLSLEQQIVLEAYEKENASQRERQFEQVRQEVQNNILETSIELVSLSEQTNTSIQALVKNSDIVKNNITKTYEQSKIAQTYANSGKMLIDELAKQNIMILENNKQMNDTVEKLIASTSQITSVIKIVQDIADQTNLLALNSAIEAARAGEYGKGFAVVSHEVKKLAEQTKQSITKVESLIQASNQYTKSANDALTKVNMAVISGNEKVALTNEAFQNIASSTTNSVANISDIEHQVIQLVDVTKEISLSMSGLAMSAENLNRTAYIG